MKAEKLDFTEAMKVLGIRAGITTSKKTTDRQMNASLYQTNELANTYFQNLLGAPEGMSGRIYLQNRGFSSEAISKFEIGFSPANGQGLLQHLVSNGLSETDAVKAGLAIQYSDGNFRDLFSARIMFPIRDHTSALSGFGGRTLDTTQPKYLNSPRTELFDKSHILYGLDKASEFIKQSKEAIVVEGYTDVIAAHQHGFNNVVASMGTALTKYQVKRLTAISRNFVLALDPDAAGQMATFRSLVDSWRQLEVTQTRSKSGFTLYHREGSEINLRIAILPQDKDPDTLIRESAEEWERIVTNAESLIDYMFSSAGTRWDLKSPEGKRQAAQELNHVLSSINEPFEQEQYRRRLAKLLEVPLPTLEASLGRLITNRPTRQPSRISQNEAMRSPFEAAEKNVLEEHLLGFIIQWPELRTFVASMEPTVINNPEDRYLLTAWLKCDTIGSLESSLDDNVLRRLKYLSSLQMPALDTSQREQAIKDCRRRLEINFLKSIKAEEEEILLQNSSVPEGFEKRVTETNEKLKRLFLEESTKAAEQ
ncbi:MAG: DNA primase [Chloroflexi bacterium]|jgi:DNA primase|nr:MAG: DNA primase [Chloroflexota bacterium]